VRLVADEHAAAQARRFARNWSTNHALHPRLVDELALVVAEVVSNAVRHGLPPYELELAEVDGMIRGQVRDASTDAPVPNPSPDHHGGFGLGIVSACTAQWGTVVDHAGKEVWFELFARYAATNGSDSRTTD
jgi:anti-sigma regulatory factor (Ser/Thr protein kinase)